MSAEQAQAALPTAALELGDDALAEWGTLRAEKRERVVRIVEYSPFPRVTRNQRRMVGFTRDESRSGMCILVDRREQPGELLRVGVRGVDGLESRDALARVVWCDGRSDGRYWLGLSVMEQDSRRMISVRRTEAEREAC